MAPRKAPAAAATDGAAPSQPSQRPRRAAASRKEPVKERSDSEAEAAEAASSSGSEAEERPVRQLRTRSSKQPTLASAKPAAAAAPSSSGRNSNQQQTAAATSAGRSGASAGRPSSARAMRGRAQARAPADEGGDDAGSSSNAESDSDDDVHVASPSDVRKQKEAQVAEARTTRAAVRPRPAAAHAKAMAAAAAAPPPPSIQLRGSTAGGRTPAAAAGAAAPTADRRQQFASLAAAEAAGLAEASGEDDSGDDREGEEEEEEEDVEEEEEEKQAGRAGATRGGGGGASRGRARGSQPLVPPTTAECRKRLFELLERRIGGTAGEGAAGGGRRTQYGDLPAKNPNKKAKLLVDLKSQFDDWHSRLRSNFSVLLYGFGSKRGLLDEFARTLAGPRNRGDAAVLVFHGYNPRCTAKEVVAGVAGALMQRTFRNLGGGAAGAGGAAGPAAGAVAACGGAAGAPAALRGLVDDIRAEPRDRHAFVVVHNIDGPGLRADMSLLSELAACPQVHVIASIDHALAPLLWDSADAARFRWQYFNATTFQPYLAETSGSQSVLVGAFKSGVVTAGAGTVLRSLVLGAQEVFKLLAEHLLEDEECEGVAFAHLYRMCRERYLVRDERVLRQHLVEFVDHQLVRLRPASDNSGELLTIPMTRADMQAVLEDLAAARGE